MATTATTPRVLRQRWRPVARAADLFGEPCPWKRRLLSAVRARFDRLPRPRRVLDAGCGHGAFVKDLLARDPSCVVTAVDRDRDALRSILAGLPPSRRERLSLRHGRLESHREPGGYELILAIDAVHQNPGRETLILERLLASLSASGVLLLVVPGGREAPARWRSLVNEAGGDLSHTEPLRTLLGRGALALYRGLRRRPVLRIATYPLSLALMALEAPLSFGEPEAWLLEVHPHA